MGFFGCLNWWQLNTLLRKLSVTGKFFPYLFVLTCSIIALRLATMFSVRVVSLFIDNIPNSFKRILIASFRFKLFMFQYGNL